MAFTSHRLLPGDLTYEPNIFVMNPDGSGQTAVTIDPGWEHGPAWSPDGRKIAFSGVPGIVGHDDIYVINPDGSGRTQLTNAPGVDEFDPEWSPDGKQIAFTSGLEGSWDIAVMNADGSG